MFSRLFKSHKNTLKTSYYFDAKGKALAWAYFDGNFQVVEQASGASPIRSGGIACASVPIGSYESIIMPKPSGSREEIRDTLRWEFSSSVEYDVEKASVDFYELPGKGEAPMLSAAIIPAAVMNTINHTLNGINVSLEKLTLPEMGIAALLDLLPGDEAYGGLVHTQEGAFIIIVHAGEIYFNQEIKNPDTAALVMDCERCVSYFKSQFSQIPLRSVFCFAQEKYQETLQREVNARLNAKGVIMKPYKFNVMKNISSLPRSVPGQIVLGLSVLMHVQREIL